MNVSAGVSRRNVPRKKVPGRRSIGPAGRDATQPSSSGSRNTSQFISVIPASVTRSVIPLRSIISCAKLMCPIPSTRMSSTGIGLVAAGSSIVFSPRRRSIVPARAPSTNTVA